MTAMMPSSSSAKMPPDLRLRFFLSLRRLSSPSPSLSCPLVMTMWAWMWRSRRLISAATLSAFLTLVDSQRAKAPKPAPRSARPSAHSLPTKMCSGTCILAWSLAST